MLATHPRSALTIATCRDTGQFRAIRHYGFLRELSNTLGTPPTATGDRHQSLPGGCCGIKSPDSVLGDASFGSSLVLFPTRVAAAAAADLAAPMPAAMALLPPATAMTAS